MIRSVFYDGKKSLLRRQQDDSDVADEGDEIDIEHDAAVKAEPDDDVAPATEPAAPPNKDVVLLNCTVCYKFFTSKKNLNKHIKLVHEKNHQCTICSKKFGRLSYLGPML